MPSRTSGEPRPPNLLIIAHPGHELRLHSWISRAKPRVCVLTDGSGQAGTSRIESSRRVLLTAGATCGSVFGRWTDRGLYERILECDVDDVSQTVEELAWEIEETGARSIVSDAIEGFSPAHDLCRIIASLALTLASQRLDLPIEHFDFFLEDAPARAAGESGSHCIELSDADLRQKLDAARAYPELRSEVERALSRHGAAAFRYEVLRPARQDLPLRLQVGDRPVYETFGAQRVAQGVYPRLLTFDDHFEPLVLALRERLLRTAPLSLA